MLTISKDQSPSWEAHSHPANEAISRLLWNPNVHYLVRKGPSLVSVLSHTHAVHTLPPYIPKIHSNIILPSTPTSSECSLPFRFHVQNFVQISHISLAYYIPRPSHPPWFYRLNNIWWSVQLWSSSLNKCTLFNCINVASTHSFWTTAHNRPTSESPRADFVFSTKSASLILLFENMLCNSGHGFGMNFRQCAWTARILKNYMYVAELKVTAMCTRVHKAQLFRTIRTPLYRLRQRNRRL